MSVKRYEPCFSHAGKDGDGLFENAQGRLVLYSDHAAEVAALRERVRVLEGAAKNLVAAQGDVNFWDAYHALEAALDQPQQKEE